jgi:hypothetical protein
MGCQEGPNGLIHIFGTLMGMNERLDLDITKESIKYFSNIGVKVRFNFFAAGKDTQ